MRLHHASTLYKNLVRIYLRQLFQPAELGNRLILAVCAILPVIIIPIVNASVIFDNFLWSRGEGDEQSLFFLGFTISILVYLVAELQVELKSKFLQQHCFMRLQGISQCQIGQAPYMTLCGLGFFVLLSGLGVVIYKGSMLHAVLSLLMGLILLYINILINSKPEEVRVAAKLFMFVLYCLKANFRSKFLIKIKTFNQKHFLNLKICIDLN